MTVDRTQLIADFQRAYGRIPSLVAEAPGRVNLIGEHTDYNGGFVLPAAIDRTVAIAASPREDTTVRARSIDYDQCDEFRVDSVRRFMGTKGWRDYVRGVGWALQDENIALRGADMVIRGDVPQGSGLSSSAALEVATAGIMTTFAGTDLPPRHLALVCQKAENLFVGVQCGVMDQLASALGVAGHALLIDCASLDCETVPIPHDVSLVAVDSHVPRKLADSAYNQRRVECEKAAAALGAGSLREAGISMLDPAMPDILLRRARHVISENGRVLAMAEAMRAGETETVGMLMYESHASLRDDFEVSTPELDLLVELACAHEGVIGARMTGAGFGGCTINLVRAGAVESFGQELRAEYKNRTGLDAEVHVCQASDGLRVTYA